MASTKLNQIIAVEKGAKTRSNEEITRAYHTLQKTDLLSGLSRTYAPKNEDGEQFPSEAKNVQIKASEVLEAAGAAFADFINITATKDYANTEARADIIVDDVVLVAGVPVTHLLFLEKQLVDIHTVIEKMPVLDVTEDWEYDSAKGVYVTPPVQTVKNKKETKVLIKYAATDKHPAQTETYTEDVPQGLWTTVKMSGAMPADKISELLERVEAVQRAVKFAREEANMREVTNVKIGDDIMAHVLGTS